MFPTTWGPIWEASFRMSSWKYASLWRNCSASSFLIRRVSEHTVSFFALAARKLEAKCQDQSWHLWQHFSSLFFFFSLSSMNLLSGLVFLVVKPAHVLLGKRWSTHGFQNSDSSSKKGMWWSRGRIGPQSSHVGCWLRVELWGRLASMQTSALLIPCSGLWCKLHHFLEFPPL